LSDDTQTPNFYVVSLTTWRDTPGGSFHKTIKRKGSGVAKPKILILDIEWRPTLTYMWGAWKQNVVDEFIVSDGGLFCVGLKWAGQKETHIYSDWQHGHKAMLEHVRNHMADADAIVTFNGDKYDLPKLEGEFILHDVALPPKAASIDLYKVCKKLGYFKNSLKFISKYLGIGAKLEHEGAAFFRKAVDGDAKALNKMERYCGQDVKLTEKLYYRILPAIRNHPYLHEINECPNCGGRKTQHRGYRYTRTQKIERIWCVNNHWFDGARKKKSYVEPRRVR
jgi:DNA polymerase elongation subunit (family B)